MGGRSTQCPGRSIRIVQPGVERLRFSLCLRSCTCTQGAALPLARSPVCSPCTCGSVRTPRHAHTAGPLVSAAPWAKYRLLAMYIVTTRYTQDVALFEIGVRLAFDLINQRRIRSFAVSHSRLVISLVRHAEVYITIPHVLCFCATARQMVSFISLELPAQAVALPLNPLSCATAELSCATSSPPGHRRRHCFCFLFCGGGDHHLVPLRRGRRLVARMGKGGSTKGLVSVLHVRATPLE